MTLLPMDFDPQDDKCNAAQNCDTQKDHDQDMEGRIVLDDHAGGVSLYGFPYRSPAPVYQRVGAPSEILVHHLGSKANISVGTGSISADIDAVICHHGIRIQH